MGALLRRKREGAFSCAFSLWSTNPQVWIVVAGCLHAGPPLPYDSRALIAVNELDLDLSGQTIRAGQKLEKLMEEVKDEMRVTILAMAEDGDEEARAVLLPTDLLTG